MIHKKALQNTDIINKWVVIPGSPLSFGAQNDHFNIWYQPSDIYTCSVLLVMTGEDIDQVLTGKGIDPDHFVIEFMGTAMIHDDQFVLHAFKGPLTS